LNLSLGKPIFGFFSRRFAAATLLTSGTLAWFFLVQFNIGDVFVSSQSNPFLVYVNPILFYGIAAISAIVGVQISSRISNRIFLFFWIIFGVLSTALVPVFQQTGLMTFSTILLGLSLGLGLPNSMAFLADSTIVEERARVSGTTIFATFCFAIGAMAAIRVFSLGVAGSVLLFALVRSFSLFAFVIDKCDRKNLISQEPRFRRPEYKDFISYVLPWMMFILVGILAWNLISPDKYASAVSIGTILRYACIAAFGIVSGVVADRFGRKPPIIFGLIILGASFAVLGFSMSNFTVIIYLMASGVAWGSFLSIYLAIPGDLAISGSREKLYVFIMILPLIIMGVLLYTPVIANFSENTSSFSQVLSLILFLSIIPVLRAKETLPESKIRERKMKKYVEKVGEVIKESKKSR
jgi:hypothetical protein